MTDTNAPNAVAALPTTPTWLITGASAGLGRALAQEVLTRGHRVVLTARDTSTLDDLAATDGDRVLVEPLDVTDADRVRDVVAAAEAWGGVDVLVNNAGYGYVGAVEEGEVDEVRAQLETNFFGPLSLIRAVLPGMRERGRGRIVNISSIGGLTTFPAVGYYHASKFALEGLSGSLAQEVAPFGLAVTVVEPGAFRTDFRGRSMRQSGVRLPAYADTAGAARDRTLASHGAQENDPALGAAAIVDVVTSAAPPRHLLLGADALRQAREQLAAYADDFDAWESVTTSTRYPDA